MVARALLGLARAIDAGPRKIFFACLFAAVISAAVVARMPIRTDLLDALPEGNPTIRAFRAFLDDFGMMDSLVLVVSSRETSPEGLITAVEAVGEALSASSRIVSVDYNLMRSRGGLVAKNFPAYLDASAFARLSERLSREGVRRQIRRNRQALLSPLASPVDSELISRDPLNLREIVQGSLLRRAVPRGLDLSTGYYMDADRTFALVMARPKGSARDMAFVGRLYAEVSGIAAKVSREAGPAGAVQVRLAGGYAHAAEASAAIWRDMVFSFCTSFVLVLLLVYLAFRPPVVILVVFVLTLFAALSWTLLFAYLLYGGLNIVTSIVAAMLIGLYVDYMIHVYHRFDEELQQGRSPLQALEATFSRTGKALLSSSTTTSVAFFSVVVTSFRGLHELGVVAGFGVLLCLLSTFLVMGSLLSWLAKAAPSRLAAGRPGGIRTGWAERLVEKRGVAVAAVFSVLLLLAIAGATRSRFDASIDAVGLAHSAVRAVERTIEEKVGRRGEPLFLVARASSDERLSGDFDTLDRQGERWRRAGMVGTFSSPSMLVPPPHAQKESGKFLVDAGLAGRYPGPDLEKVIREEMEMQGMVPGDGLGPYVSGIAGALAREGTVDLTELARSGDPRASYFYNKSRSAIAAHMTSPGTRWDRLTLSSLKDDVSAMGADFALVGPSLIFEEIRSSILRESFLAILISFAANWIIVGFHFKRIRNVALVMVPVTVGTILTVGAMGAAGIPFNFFNVAGIALIFGFGVDYGIYLMQAHMDGAGASGSDAVHRTGGDIVLCSVTTVASCGSLITSQYRGLASIGGVLCLGAAFCLLSTVLLLPVLLRWADCPGGRR